MEIHFDHICLQQISLYRLPLIILRQVDHRTVLVYYFLLFGNLRAKSIFILFSVYAAMRHTTQWEQRSLHA